MTASSTLGVTPEKDILLRMSPSKANGCALSKTQASMACGSTFVPASTTLASVRGALKAILVSSVLLATVSFSPAASKTSCDAIPYLRTQGVVCPPIPIAFTSSHSWGLVILMMPVSLRWPPAQSNSVFRKICRPSSEKVKASIPAQSSLFISLTAPLSPTSLRSVMVPSTMVRISNPFFSSLLITHRDARLS